ncbi:hypothetical protein ABB55_10565 [Prosthecomicrobium hirschii]|jgi:hypothetical protein|uniref:PepSY domain-containing protein n=1 Tax=Prosthecodimorpha hirschii TaxID=665126 RepID=A0A0P6VJH2_9HYPH|nr:hypothetical protein [Prosthecomicrobium hirschii]KPL52611.1 hypothetical protein ABB55_10565 [Prosthecomicrobium hirschii]
MPRLRHSVAAALLAVIATPPPFASPAEMGRGTSRTGAVAAPDRPGGRRHLESAAADHEKARQALARGEVKSLDEILGLVTLSGQDNFVEVSLDRTDGRWIYAMTLLTAGGRYRVVTIDAATAKVLKEELK